MKKIICFLILITCLQCLRAQQLAENLVIVTMDGMRWQEVMGGIDSSIVKNKIFTRDSSEIEKKFGGINDDLRREKLFPFLWKVVARDGQIYGNRNKGNFVDVANHYWFSYPGYNEIFTGFPDSTINSNDFRWNKNENVLAFISNQKSYINKVAVFATWGAYPYIFNTKRNHQLFVNADIDSLKFSTKNLMLINDMQFLTTQPVGERPDIFTYMAAREYLKAFQPKVLYIAFDETDDFAHAGMYDQYLKSAHAEDGMLADLWQTIQSMPNYKNNTTLLITCDHGRGRGSGWTSHGSAIPGSNQIWIACIGPETKALGELRNHNQLYQKQLAATIAKLLGFDFTASHPIAEPIKSIYQ